MDELILKYLQHQKLSEKERKELEHWLEESSNNRKAFEHIVNQWLITDSEVQKTKQRIFHQITSEAAQKKKGFVVTHISWRVAASLAFLVGLISTLLIYFSPLMSDQSASKEPVLVTKSADFGQKLTIHLQDGSTVTLNAGTTISYPKNFDKVSRNIELEGEAFFDVSRDEKRPFVIMSHDMQVTVLGTSFNVRAYSQDEIKEVAVLTGKVKVSSVKNNTDHIELLAQEKAILDKHTNHFTKQKIVDSLSTFGWVKKHLVFKDATLSEIFQDLERWYGIQFVIHKPLEMDKSFTGKYYNPSLELVMESLSYAYDFNYSIENDEVKIE